MLTDVALKNLKPKEKPYKVTDRDGMYVLVSTTGTVSFRLDYRLNGRRETVVLGRYDKAGISLARARELCIDAKRMIREGRSPAFEKQRAKRRLLEAKSFGEFGEKWLTMAPLGSNIPRPMCLKNGLGSGADDAFFQGSQSVQLPWDPENAVAETIENKPRAMRPSGSSNSYDR